MKILALDTATESCSVAVADTATPSLKTGTLAELTNVTRQTHSRHLMEMIRTALGMSGLALADLDGFAVAKGPGSFTGLRIGISTVKGLATALGKPVAGISNLDALAFPFAFWPHLICTLVDARKKEVYFAGYRTDGGVLKKEMADTVCTPDAAISQIDAPCLFVGNGALLYQELIADKLGERVCFAPSFYNTIRASTLVSLSLEKFETGNTDDVAAFVPHYIRKSDAELNFKKAR